jgi:transposase
MPGVGTVLAFTLIALPPELGKMSRKQIAALVGLFDTAAFTGVECRSIMFTGPPSAQAGIIPPSRPSPIASPGADTKSKVIIVAVMRKMITTLNAMLHDNAAWQLKSA